MAASASALILNIDREAEHSPDDFCEDIYGKITLTSGDKRTKYLHTPRPELQEGQGDFRTSSREGDCVGLGSPGRWRDETGGKVG